MKFSELSPSARFEYATLEVEKEDIIAESERKKRWKTDPVFYAKDRFGIDFWDKQADVAMAVEGNRTVVCYSGNGIGKTFLCSILAVWWLDVMDEDAIVFITGSNWHVIENAVLPQIMRFIQRHNLFDKSEKGILSTKITLKNGNRLIARATNSPEGLASLHTRNMLTICEETSGMDKPIVDALKGNSTGEHNHIIYLGNPLSPTGVFYDICSSTHYPVFQISALDVPNVRNGTETIPGAATRSSVLAWFEDEKINPCTPDTPGAVHLEWLGDRGWYVPNHVIFSRVLGQFPDSSEDALIPRQWLERAAKRSLQKTGLPALGCDPARGGDKSMLAFAYPDGIERFENINITIDDLNGQMKIAGKLMQYKDKVSSITVDVGMGTGIIDRVKEQGVGVREFNFGGTAELSEPDKFADMVTEAAWRLREALETNPNFSIPNDAEFIQEASERRYQILSNGKKKLEQKKEFKKRLKRSPDKFDAAIMAYWIPKPGDIYFNDVYMG